MEEIGIRELRKDLSRQVKSAGVGRSIVITIDGEPTARLGPLAEPVAGTTMGELIAAGRVLPPRRGGEPRRSGFKRIKVGRSSQEILDEVRADRL